MPNYKVYYLLLPMDSWTYTVAPQKYAAHRLGTAVLDIHTICHISSSVLSYHTYLLTYLLHGAESFLRS